MGKGEIVMRISTRGSYALEAVLAIAMMQDAGSVSIREISERTMISDNYLGRYSRSSKRAASSGVFAERRADTARPFGVCHFGR
jgi:hypothetical protein